MARILVADIGGTNSRFAVFNADRKRELDLVDEVYMKSNSFETFQGLLSELTSINSKFSPSLYKHVVLAVPAPIIGDNIIRMVNVGWSININALRKKYAPSRIHFINDFTAQAYGCLTKKIRSAKVIKKGKASTGRDIAIVGAGTGLGHGAIKFDERYGYVPIQSEAGHIAFPFTCKEELEYREFVLKMTGCDYPTSEGIVSGSGLALLHRFLTGEDLTPEQVTGKISVHSETTRWFAGFYGRCCKNYCLNLLSSGGRLFLSGGLAAQNPFLVDNDAFREEFVSSPLKAELLKQISIYLNKNEKIALWGAALYGALA